MENYQLLILEIDDEKVEEIRVFSETTTKKAVIDFKEVYHLKDNDNYCFYIIAQSKMNFKLLK